MGRVAAMLLVLIFLAAVSATSVQPASSQLTSRKIDIKPDGSIMDSDPITPIQQNGNVYTFTGDIYGRLDIQKGNIVVDGAGYALIKSELDFAIIVGTDGGVPEPVGVSGITIMNLRIIGFNYGITLGGENNIVQRVNITDSKDYNGIPIWVSGSNHAIRECRITGNQGYGMLIHAKGAVLSNNYIADNGNFGIHFYDRAATLRNNTLNNNGGGPFLMDEMSVYNPGEPFQIISNDIDPSNVVNGKPVYYWVNEHNKTVPSDAGYVVLDSCTNIEVKALSINRNSAGYFFYGSGGISLIRSGNSTISDNTLNGTGIYISYSSQDILVANNKITSAGVYSWGSNISVIGNTISTSKDGGIQLGGPANAIVANNTLLRCEIGINLQQSSQNKIAQNSIADCNTGINLFSSSNNVFHHNSFVNNKRQVSETHYSLQWPIDVYYQSANNKWDGNFWSDYNGTDANRDGVGDIPYVVFENYTDHSPLMASFTPADIQQSPSPSPSEQPQPTPPSNDGVTPRISILSPANTTYAAIYDPYITVPLTFETNASLSWVGYSLDGGSNVTVKNGTVILIPSESRSLTLYANDTAGNWAAPQTVYYEIAFNLGPVREPFPVVPVAAVAVVAAGVAVGVLVYWKKRIREVDLVKKS